MAKTKLKEKAIKLRKKGRSYSQIKKEVGVSKSTLSLWLRDYPLSEKRIRELRDNNPRRIEKFRNTMRKKRETRRVKTYNRVSKRIGNLSDREFFIAGLFLYWGEGLKHGNTTTSLSNTDPKTIKFFMKWLIKNGVPYKKIYARLHLYSDMNIEKEINFWSKAISLPKRQFKKPYVKESKKANINFQSYGHGTCNIIYYNEPLKREITESLKYIRDKI